VCVSVYLSVCLSVSVSVQSEAGQRYLAAMKCAANYAFVNRSLVEPHVEPLRRALKRALKVEP